ncbi:cysteine desulfurase [Myxococcota bacterium]|nr:cysteine desulfurase [Myxococcota bacterium]
MPYLDHNASALPDREAAAAAARWLLEGVGNPSSVHTAGRRARAALERARRQVATALGATPGEVVFTSGATEALHLAVAGLAAPGAHVLLSAVEHPAVFGACRAAELTVETVPVDGLGRVRVKDVVARCRPETAFVAVMAAQNELGNVYPVSAIAAAIGAVPLIVDAVQLFGRRPLDVERLGASIVVVSGHKVGGPAGIGALWVRPGLCLRPVLRGGPQERGRRGGTENVAGAIGFGVAADRLGARLAAMPRVLALREAAEMGLRCCAPGIVFHGDPQDRLPNTLSFRIPGIPGDVLLAALDLEGFCLSSGAACASGGLEPSPVLLALGLDPGEARGAVRLSLGPETEEADVASFIDVLPALLARIHSAGLTEPG